MPGRHQKTTSKVTARCHLPLLHWILSDGYLEKASIREDIQRLPPQPSTSAYPSGRNICPQPWPSMEIPDVMAEWSSNPQSRQGRPLCQEPLPPERGPPLPSTSPAARSLRLGQGPPLSMDTGHFVQGWPGVPLFPDLDLTHMPSGPWLGLYPPTWPLAPTLTLAGRGKDPSWLSQCLPPCIQLLIPTSGKPSSRLGWSPLMYAPLSRTVDRCGSWPCYRQVAADWAHAHKTMFLSDLPLIPLLCWGCGLVT